MSYHQTPVTHSLRPQWLEDIIAVHPSHVVGSLHSVMLILYKMGLIESLPDALRSIRHEILGYKDY